MDYVGRAPVIINYTITAVNTWERVTPEIKGIRKWFIRAANDTDNAFRLAFTAAPTTYLTSDGSGFTFDGCALPDVYVYCSTASTKFELIYWN